MAQAKAITANPTVKAVLEYLNTKSSSSVPTGAICFFATTAIPTGWLLCNGSNVSRTEYAALFAAIGTKFGAGDGSTTFTLPNLDDRFIEGTTDTAKVGQYLEAGLPNITGWFTLGQNSGHYSKVDGELFYFGEADRSAAATANANDAHHAVFDPSRVDPLYGRASTVQVASLRLLPCIKF